MPPGLWRGLFRVSLFWLVEFACFATCKLAHVCRVLGIQTKAPEPIPYVLIIIIIAFAPGPESDPSPIPSTQDWAARFVASIKAPNSWDSPNLWILSLGKSGFVLRSLFPSCRRRRSGQVYTRLLRSGGACLERLRVVRVLGFGFRVLRVSGDHFEI